VTRNGTLLLCLLLAPAPSFAKPAVPALRVNAPMVPTPRPTFSAPTAPEAPMDLSHALPGKSLAKLPSSAQQLKSLSSELKEGRPQLATAKEKSETLAKEAASLKKKLI
jgi:hypothetical protein